MNLNQVGYSRLDVIAVEVFKDNFSGMRYPEISACANATTVTFSVTIDFETNTPLKCAEYCVNGNYDYFGTFLKC